MIGNPLDCYFAITKHKVPHWRAVQTVVRIAVLYGWFGFGPCVHVSSYLSNKNHIFFNRIICT